MRCCTTSQVHPGDGPFSPGVRRALSRRPESFQGRGMSRGSGPWTGQPQVEEGKWLHGAQPALADWDTLYKAAQVAESEALVPPAAWPCCFRSSRPVTAQLSRSTAATGGRSLAWSRMCWTPRVPSALKPIISLRHTRGQSCGCKEAKRLRGLSTPNK